MNTKNDTKKKTPLDVWIKEEKRKEKIRERIRDKNKKKRSTK